MRDQNKDKDLGKNLNSNKKIEEMRDQAEEEDSDLNLSNKDSFLNKEVRPRRK